MLKYENVALDCEKEENEYFKSGSLIEWIDEWSFKNYRTDMYTHKIHKYPAMFIPQLVRKIIETYSNKGDNVLDIFNGSGSTLVECKLLDRNGYGIELNPLANLISNVKTSYYDYSLLLKNLDWITNNFEKYENYRILSFKNIDFWYSTEVAKYISKLLSILETFDVKSSVFFKVALSDIIREISWCKHSGFKMHRDEKKINNRITEEQFIAKFHKTALNNIDASKKFMFATQNSNATTTIYEGDSKAIHPIEPSSIDLIVTSPPYGDSKTTVAYGQFSRLSLQWFGLTPLVGNEVNLDNYLLGGIVNKLEQYEYLLNKSQTISSIYELFRLKADTYEKIEQKKQTERLRDVMAFYADLDKTIANAAIYLKKDKYLVLVTGSRVVKNIKLHTDIIISELAVLCGFELKGIMYRNIESKRMPSKVSSTNVKGKVSPTMTKESIIILKKLI